MAGFHKETSATDSSPALGKAGSIKNRKLDRGQGSTGTSPPCSQCGSAKTWKDGVRETSLGPVQRYLCRSCAYRFSEPNSKQAQRFFNGSGMSEHVETIHAKTLKSKAAILTYCRVSDEPIKRASTGQLRLVKSLAEVETRNQERAAGATPDQATVKGLLTQYIAYLEKEGYSQDIKYPQYLKRLVRLGANLLDPENVKEYIAKQPWKNSMKMLVVQAYNIMATKIIKTSWTPPKYKQADQLPFVPEEKELDQLIAACKSKRMATYLQTLKETYADPGEILRLRWIDLDFSNNVISINFPVKGHNAGQIKVSAKLMAMLNCMPKTSERIFPTTYSSLRKCFVMVRKRAAQNLQNPRLLAISFRTFRHWGGTMLAHYTHGNVLTVQRILRHKNIQNTMKYIHMICFKDDEFDVATATTVEEIKQLATAGFEKFDEINSIHIYRRPKRFNS